VETYNYESFSRSESAGKSNEFKNSLRAGEGLPISSYPVSTVTGFASPHFGAKSMCCSNLAASPDRRLWARSRP
jgi:hypothetical protein